VSWSFGEPGSIGWLKGEQVAVKPIVHSTDGRFDEIVLVAVVLLVQIAWGAGLIFLAVHFL
jgi:hypothetical protein